MSTTVFSDRNSLRLSLSRSLSLVLSFIYSNPHRSLWMLSVQIESNISMEMMIFDALELVVLRFFVSPSLSNGWN